MNDDSNTRVTICLYFIIIFENTIQQGCSQKNNHQLLEFFFVWFSYIAQLMNAGLAVIVGAA